VFTFYVFSAAASGIIEGAFAIATRGFYMLKHSYLAMGVAAAALLGLATSAHAAGIIDIDESAFQAGAGLITFSEFPERVRWRSRIADGDIRRFLHWPVSGNGGDLSGGRGGDGLRCWESNRSAND
jgi:hypothetical protein